MALALPPKFLRELENPARQPFALLQIDSTGQSTELTSESDFATATSETDVDYDATYKDLTSATYKWTASGSGANEFYCEIAAGGDPSLAPQNTLIMDNVWLTKATLGSLNDHEFGYGDNDSLGYSTIYVADATGDPDISGQTIEINGQPPDTAGDCVLAADNTSTSVTGGIFATTDEVVGNVSYNGESTGWECVDDPVGVPDDDTTYVRHAGNHQYLGGGLTTQILQDIPEHAVIQKLTITVRMMHEQTSTRDGFTRMKYDGTVYTIGATHVVTTSYANFSVESVMPPAGTGGWTRAKLALIQGIGMLSDSTSPWTRMTQCYMTITYYDFPATGSVVLPLDLGASAATANSGIISIDDLVPTNSTLTYTAEGSTTGSWGGEEVALGAVEDGSVVAGYRYYRITGSFTSDGTVTAVLKSIKIEIPDNVYLYSSLSDYTLSAYPFLKSIPGRNIKLNMKDFITEGSSLTVSLVRNDIVDSMVRSDNFRGLNTTIRIGMFTDDITTADLLEYYQGRVADYAVDETELKVTLKDMSKDLSFKLPDQTGTSKSTTEFDGTHMAVVLNTLMDSAGIASRYIDRGSLNTIEANIGDGTPAASNWVVKRTGNMVLAEPETAKKLISELLVVMGCYMVIQESGKAVFVEYDSSTAAQETWGDDDLLAGFTYKPNLESIRNQIFLYYDHDGGGTAESDFASIYVASDATSISDWGITASQVIKSPWVAGDSSDGYYGDEMAAHLASRELTRLKDGLGVLSCRTSLDKAHIQAGDFINIDSSDGIDVLFAADVASEATQKFIVTSKNWDVAGGSINWELTEAR